MLSKSTIRSIVFMGIFLFTLIFLAACQAQETPPPAVDPSPAETASPEQTLVLGDVSGNAAWSIEHFSPLAEYLAENLSDYGYTSGRVIVSSDLETMMGYLESGEVDIYFDSPYPSLEVYEKIGAIPLLRRWKSGVSEYHTVIVTLKGGEIEDLDDLMGKMIAYDHPASTSGYLLPTAYGEETEAAWVIKGKVAAAAFSNGDLEDLHVEQQEQLTTLAQTPSVPRNIVLAWPGMDEKLQSRIIELLLELHQTPEGTAILETFENTSKFDSLPWGLMETLQELFAPVR